MDNEMIMVRTVTTMLLIKKSYSSLTSQTFGKRHKAAKITPTAAVNHGHPCRTRLPIWPKMRQITATARM